ncbi:Lipase 3 [Blattella germanica]|nr:Lipase 3 [Blattella germanica]
MKLSQRVVKTHPELITKYGYPVEEHTVQTKDGYILTHFRIPNGYKGSTGKRGPPIILQHGIFSASDLWILMGREKSLDITNILRIHPTPPASGFILADEGYDVWLTNIRGNRHNRKHLELSPKSKKFWDFSWHEMGHFDMPATIDYILATTGEKKVYYVGHSMGTTMMFVMNSCRPEYNDKIRIAFALAPVAYLGNPKHQLLKGILPSSKMIAKILDQAKLWEILPYNKALAQILASMCRKGAPTHNFCLHIYNLANGPDLEQLNETMLPVYITHLMAGASLKTVHHYAQIMSSGRFQAFDYGPEVNLEKYGQRTPPDYNGVQTLSRRLPRLVGTSRVIPPKFNHLDFILANDAKPLLFEHILNLLKVY